MGKAFQTKAKVIKNIEVAQKYYRILLSCPGIAQAAKPGQFLQVRVSDDCPPLLRRPFSIHRVTGKLNRVEILYAVLGKGTEILSQRKPGEYLDVIGPLGNGFNFPLPITPALPAGRGYPLPVLVAGGVGVAPLLFLAERLTRGPRPAVHGKPLVIIGAQTKKDILCEKEFKRLGAKTMIATDDGSRGFQGKATDLLKQILPTAKSKAERSLPEGDCQEQSGAKLPRRGLSTIYACGPRAMLKEISAVSKRYQIPAQISLEEHLACGIGACLGCVVNTKEGYQRVCKDGPVFDARQIIWGKE